MTGGRRRGRLGRVLRLSSKILGRVKEVTGERGKKIRNEGRRKGLQGRHINSAGYREKQDTEDGKKREKKREQRKETG